MRFGEFALADAVGAIAAHSLRAPGIAIRKGTVLTADHVAALAATGMTRVVAARLDEGDVGEDVAAGRLAEVVAGPGVRRETPFTGRCNLFADVAGVLDVAGTAVDAVNAIDERITLATLPPFRSVQPGDMVATIKIIPYAVPEVLLAAGERAAAGAPVVRVWPYLARRVAMISTLLPALKPQIVDKTLNVLGRRLAPAGAGICADIRIPHETASLAAALVDPRLDDAELIVIFGASAVADRCDVVPAAIERAGGRVERLGMPVDPGNLLLLAELGGRPVLGAPGCARSPKENGFDWVLHRLLAGLPVSGGEIAGMGVGGLLMEIVSRPQPRAGGESEGEADDNGGAGTS